MITLDYDEIDMSLHRAQVEGEPAEIHGTLCAILCTRTAVSAGIWIDDEVLNGYSESENLDTCRSLLKKLSQLTHSQLSGDEFSLQLLLPSDETPASERGAALAAWCDGFLYGLGLAGEGVLDDLSSDARELVSDLGEFTQIDTELEESDDTEAAYMEISEYVRMGTVMIYQEIGLPEDPDIVPDNLTRH